METITCPVCHHDDELEWVGNILEKGTSHTTTGGMIFSPGDGLSPVLMGGTTRSEFVGRFVPPRKFGTPSLGSILGILLLSLLAWDLIINIAFFQTPFGWLWFFTAILSLLGAIPLAIVTTVVVELIRFALNASKRKFWNYAYNRLWYSVYCERDNVIFGYGYCAVPQEYIRHLFSPFRIKRPAIGYNQGA